MTDIDFLAKYGRC